MSLDLQKPKFDWYSASLDDPAEHVVQSLLDNFDALQYRPGKPRNGYTHAADLVMGHALFASVQWGSNPGTHVAATGSNSAPFAKWLRALFPDHRVSRLDVAIDYDGPGTFEQMRDLLVSHADEYHLKTAVAGDWLNGEDGRTLYVGSRSSPAFLRLYEKGKQLSSVQHPHWTRLELEVKPANLAARKQLAKASPAACFGASKWSSALAVRLGSVQPQRVFAGSIEAPTDDQRAFAHLVKQYGPLLARIASELPNGWYDLGPLLCAAHNGPEAKPNPAHRDQLELFNQDGSPRGMGGMPPMVTHQAPLALQ